MHTLFLLLLWFPQDPSIQDALQRLRTDLDATRTSVAAMEARLQWLEGQVVDPPVDPPPTTPPPPGNAGSDPPTGTPSGNLLRLFAPPPAERFAVRFCGPVAFEGIQSEPIAWGPQGEPTAFLLEGTIDPDTLPAGELDDLELPLELLSPAWPKPSRLPSIPLTVQAGGALSAANGLLPSGQSISLGALRATGWARQWRPGIFEYEVLLEGTADRYFERVALGWLQGTRAYLPDVPNSEGLVLVEDGGLPFIWLKGQTTVRRFLVGREITAEDRQRFRAFEHFVLLVGPDSYHGRGGWGATRARLPLLTPTAVGYDLAQVKQLDGAEDARRYEEHVLEGHPHPEFKYDDGLGPWHPRGDRSGGGSGGSEIYPYAGWAGTPGEAWCSWWQMRTMMERMPVDYYANGLPASKPEWFRPYEKELIKYQPHDGAHLQRAMLSASGCAWNAGSPAGASWLRGLSGRFDIPEPYPSEFEGQGHPHAHRADGWAATRLATGYALAAPDRPERAALRTLAEVQADRMLRVAMPSGLTHRSGDIHAGGPFAAWLNPNLWELGKLPEGTTIARNIMTAINANGAMALEQSVFGDGRMAPLIVNAAASTYFEELPGSGFKTPPRGQTIVGGLEFGEVYPETQFSALDDSVNAWECQWHLVDAYRVSGDVRFLERAAEIMGHGVPLPEIPAAEYARTGSARAWWSYTPEVVAEIQALK